MRWLPLFVLVGCSSKATEKPAPPPAPTPPAPAVAPAPPAAPNPLAIGARCPVGDGTNVAVYGFLERELKDARAEDQGRDETRAALGNESIAEASKGQLKPPRASIVESETSHVLSTLCAGTRGCVAVGLYNPSGLAIALSSLGTIAPLGFGDDARWATLLKESRDEGVIVELTCAEAKASKLPCDGGHRFVLFPVANAGLALCIVES